LYSFFFTDIFIMALPYRSPLKPIVMKNGFDICPKGYILALDTASTHAAPRLGHCTQCSAGTYSVNPLYGGPVARGGGGTVGLSDSPKCISCAAGGMCLGGDKVLVHDLLVI
jgi:hypothetical protein